MASREETDAILCDLSAKTEVDFTRTAKRTDCYVPALIVIIFVLLSPCITAEPSAVNSTDRPTLSLLGSITQRITTTKQNVSNHENRTILHSTVSENTNFMSNNETEIANHSSSHSKNIKTTSSLSSPSSFSTATTASNKDVNSDNHFSTGDNNLDEINHEYVNNELDTNAIKQLPQDTDSLGGDVNTKPSDGDDEDTDTANEAVTRIPDDDDAHDENSIDASLINHQVPFPSGTVVTSTEKPEYDRFYSDTISNIAQRQTTGSTNSTTRLTETTLDVQNSTVPTISSDKDTSLLSTLLQTKRPAKLSTSAAGNTKESSQHSTEDKSVVATTVKPPMSTLNSSDDAKSKLLSTLLQREPTQKTPSTASNQATTIINYTSVTSNVPIYSSTNTNMINPENTYNPTTDENVSKGMINTMISQPLVSQQPKTVTMPTSTAQPVSISSSTSSDITNTQERTTNYNYNNAITQDSTPNPLDKELVSSQLPHHTEYTSYEVSHTQKDNNTDENQGVTNTAKPFIETTSSSQSKQTFDSVTADKHGSTNQDIHSSVNSANYDKDTVTIATTRISSERLTDSNTQSSTLTVARTTPGLHMTTVSGRDRNTAFTVEKTTDYEYQTETNVRNTVSVQNKTNTMKTSSITKHKGSSTDATKSSVTIHSSVDWSSEKDRLHTTTHTSVMTEVTYSRTAELNVTASKQTAFNPATSSKSQTKPETQSNTAKQSTTSSPPATSKITSAQTTSTTAETKVAITSEISTSTSPLLPTTSHVSRSTTPLPTTSTQSITSTTALPTTHAKENVTSKAVVKTKDTSTHLVTITTQPPVTVSLETVITDNVTTNSSLVEPSASSSMGAAAWTGIGMGALVGFWVILGPIVCIICRTKDKAEERKERKRSRDSMNQGLIEQMIFMELARGREKIYKTSLQDIKEIEKLTYTDIRDCELRDCGRTKDGEIMHTEL